VKTHLTTKAAGCSATDKGRWDVLSGAVHNKGLGLSGSVMPLAHAVLVKAPRALVGFLVDIYWDGDQVLSLSLSLSFSLSLFLSLSYSSNSLSPLCLPYSTNFPSDPLFPQDWVSGEVLGYDDATKKHAVRYADGDTGTEFITEFRCRLTACQTPVRLTTDAACDESMGEKAARINNNKLVRFVQSGKGCDDEWRLWYVYGLAGDIEHNQVQTELQDANGDGNAKKRRKKASVGAGVLPRLVSEGRIELITGDITQSLLFDATAIFVNNVCFPDTLMNWLVSVLATLPKLTRFVSMRKLCGRCGPACAKRGRPCAQYRLLWEQQIAVTWCKGAPCYLYEVVRQ
jgi:hypothetical protein